MRRGLLSRHQDRNHRDGNHDHDHDRDLNLRLRLPFRLDLEVMPILTLCFGMHLLLTTPVLAAELIPSEEPISSEELLHDRISLESGSLESGLDAAGSPLSRVPSATPASSAQGVIHRLLQNAIRKDRQKTVTEASELASSLLLEAIASSQRARPILEAVAAALLTTDVHYPRDGEDFKHCVDHPYVLAFTAYPNNAIYLCALSFSAHHGSNVALAQAMIHQATYLADYRDECVAAQIENYAVLNSGFRPYKNAYWERCGVPQ